MEQQMIELLKKKDRRTIQEVYELYSPTLLAICMRYFKQHDLALDAMHEGFMKALSSIQSFNNQGSFEGWLKRIVVNNSLDTLRKEQKNKHLTIEDIHAIEEPVDEVKTIDRKDINEKVIDAGFVRDADFTVSEMLEEIHRLPEIYCIVFILFELEEFTHAQIGTQLGINEKASRKRLARARKMIKEALYNKSIAVLGK